jgi:molybdopterin synthase sulfur carrier subunit
MAIVRIPMPLRNFVNGEESVQIQGANVKEILDNLESNHPGIKTKICDDAGAVRRFINIYANEEDIRFMKNLDTVFTEKDEMKIVPAIAGGSL